MNAPTAIAALGVAIVLFFPARALIRGRGKACSCGCADCPRRNCCGRTKENG